MQRLMDYVTGDYLRPATAEEVAMSREVVDGGDEEGVFVIDSRTEWPDYPESARRCWVDGPLVPETERDRTTIGDQYLGLDSAS